MISTALTARRVIAVTKQKDTRKNSEQSSQNILSWNVCVLGITEIKETYMTVSNPGDLKSPAISTRDISNPLLS